MSGPDSALAALIARARSLGPDEQLDFLRTACGADHSLFANAIMTLHSTGASGWWNRSYSNADAAVDEDSSLVGTLIGHYRVTGELGAGGMGRVLLAERADEQFTHQVAIKLVRGDLVSKQVQGRLRIERQILATLDHPNIAKLLDGGTHRGVPYIVMEYVDGQPIDTYCNSKHATIRERLELFRTVCSAVHYAHQNLIVHRDLKPTNILVTPEGVPKLLDFGIAKLLDSRQVTHTMAVTHFDTRLMTPDHASPEQVRGDPITTASDTYVLGVLLYELLTGRKPLAFRPERLQDLERAICEQSPAPLAIGLRGESRLPSDFLEEICQQRRTTPARLRKDLGGELEAIARMALRKEPERRYSSVERFSEDIGRYLSGLPVVAKRDTWTYRTQKFVNRHALGVAMAALAVVALAAVSVVMALQAQRIGIERANAEEVSTFLVDMFEHADPEQSRGNEVTVRELLDTASKRLDSDLQEQPATKSRLLATLGTVYGRLGIYADAKESLRDALALRRASLRADYPQIADAERRLAEVLVDSEDLREAEALLTSALEIYRKQLGAQSAEYVTTLQKFALLRQRQERLDEAEHMYAECIRILEAADATQRASLVTGLNGWAELLIYRKNYRDAEEKYRSAQRIGQSALGADHPLVAESMLGVAVALAGQSRFAEAQPLYEQSLGLYRRILGADHPQTAQVLATYGSFLRRAGKLSEAEAVLRETVRVQSVIRGPHHVRTAYAQSSLALVFLESQRPVEAKEQFELALNTYARELPEDHLYVSAALLGLGRALLALKQPREAATALERAENIAVRQYDRGTVAVASIVAARGGALLLQNSLAAAEPLLLESYPVLLASRGSADSFTLQVKEWIALLYSRQGESNKADRFFASLPAN